MAAGVVLESDAKRANPSGVAKAEANEDDFDAFDRMKFEAMRYTMSKLPRTARRKLLHSRPSQYEMTACYAGKTEPVHEKILEKAFQLYI